MRRMNVIAIFTPDGKKVLMCLRKKDPYKGLLNLIGGKAEAGESGEDAAWREMREETGYTREDIELAHIMDFTYYLEDIQMELWAGRLKEMKKERGEENELMWLDMTEDFFDRTRFAGMGNIGHMMEELRAFHII